MIKILDAKEWNEKVMALPRPIEKKVFAFYEHRIGAICRDARCMLVPMDDHLVHRGDAVFETLLITERTVINVKDHLKRLKHSAEGIKLSLPCSLEEIGNIIMEVAKAADVADANIRVLVGRGMGGFGISPLECDTPSLYVVVYDYKPHPEEWYEKGLTTCRSNIPLKSSLITRLKTTNYITSVMMVQEAIEKNVDLALSFDNNNCLAEAAVASVAIVDKDGIFTVPMPEHILAGTTMLKAYEYLKAQMPVAMRDIPESELPTVKEMMILGTSHACVGAVKYEDHIIADGKPGPVAKIIRQFLDKELVREGSAF